MRQHFSLPTGIVMIKFSIASLVVFLFSMSCAWSADDTTPSAGKAAHRDWHVSANIAYTSRTLDGSIVNRTAIANDVFGDLVATGDSMNLGSSDSFMYTLAAQYKKWGVGLNYAPTSFSGQGYAIVELAGNQAGVVAKTPLNTNIKVNMLLTNATYNFIQTKYTSFGVGVGFGRTDIDLNIIPQAGNSIIYKGEQPFGFLNLHMANNYQGFLYGFSLNSISASFSGVDVDYSDYKVDLGYRVIDDKVKWDIVGGYRLVNFSIDIEYDGDIVKATTNLKGPFLGVTVIY
jgi:hypothetical protein